MNNNLPELPREDRTVDAWLRRYFEHRSIAEMSVWFCITAVTSMIIAVVASVGLGSLAGAAGKSDATAGTVVLGGLILWLGFLAWLWCTRVCIARG